MPKILNPKVSILKNDRNPDGSYIEYDAHLHQGKPTREISRDTFRAKIRDSKLVTILADEKNQDGTFIQFDPNKHQGKAIREISYNRFKMKSKNQRTVDVLANERTAEGAYIKFNPTIHQGKQTVAVKIPTYKASIKHHKPVTIPELNNPEIQLTINQNPGMEPQKKLTNNQNTQPKMTNHSGSPYSFFVSTGTPTSPSIRARMNITQLLNDDDNPDKTQSVPTLFS